MEQLDQDALMKGALKKIKALQAKIDAVEKEHHEAVAIIGMSCRFPGGANTPQRFWTLLQAGENAVTEIPASRWKLDEYYHPDPQAAGKMHIRHGAFLEGIETFEPTFFGIAPREAISLDPQQRLLLETTWEALESANIVPATLFDSSTGVFVGICGSNYEHLLMNNSSQNLQYELYSSTGSATSVAAGRLSYTLGFMGPSVATDTACSSSLVTVHQACQSLRLRECDLALAGGVSVILRPEDTIMFAKAGMLAVDGRCKTFDAAADGYVRGEGCGMIVLKRLSDAVAAKDNILAVIRGSMINHDGHSSGLTAPRGPAQEAVIRQALRMANLAPSAVSYIEAHGTGTPLGDPIEMRALGNVFGQRTEPLWVGSVKTNIGHLEGAAGIAGLLKVVLMLQHSQIPPHLHLQTPNPYIDWSHLPIQIAKTLQPWDDKKRIAGISSFGYSGTNAHIIVEAWDPQQSENVMAAPLSPAGSSSSERHDIVTRHLLTLSAKSEPALMELAARYQEFLSTQSEMNFADLCYTAHTGRSHFVHRLAIVTANQTEACEKLVAFAAHKNHPAILQGNMTGGNAPTIAFLFSGQGSQYVNMGRELYETKPTFRATIERCDAILRPLLGESILSVIYPDKETSRQGDKVARWQGEGQSKIDDTVYTQPALFALEYALAMLWQSWGIVPDFVMGHSVGEIVAACVAGLFSLEDGLKLIAARGRLMGGLPQDGEMLAVMTNEIRVQQTIAAYPSEVAIAAINSPESIVISGRRKQVLEIAEQLANEGIKTRRLNVSHAFHSSLMQPILSGFRQVATSLTYHKPMLPIVSNVSGKVAGDEVMTPDYWVRHVREAVRFADGVATLQAQGVNTFLEIGPKPVLLGMTQSKIQNSVMLPSLREGRSDWQQMLESLGALYVAGMKIDWAGFEQGYQRHKVVIPTYPFQRQRYWLDAPKPKRHSQTLRPLIDKMIQSPAIKETLFETALSLDTVPFLNDHRIYGAVVAPGACHLSMLLSAAELAFARSMYQLKDVILPQPLTIGDDERCTAQIIFTPVSINGRGNGSGNRNGNDGGPQADFQLISFDGSSVEPDTQPLLHASGTVSTLHQTQPAGVSLAVLQARCTEIVAIDAEHTASDGDDAVEDAPPIRFGPAFCWIDALWQSPANAENNGSTSREVLGRFRRPAVIENSTGYLLHPGLLDACFQVAAHTSQADAWDSGLYIPFALASLRLYKVAVGDTWWCHAEQVGEMQWNLRLFDPLGQVIAEIEHFELRSAPQTAIHTTRLRTDWLYTLDWEAEPLMDRPVNIQRPDCWLLLGDADGVCTQLADALSADGTPAILVTPGTTFSLSANLKSGAVQQATIDPSNPLMFKQLLSEVATRYQSVGIGYLWGMDDALGHFDPNIYDLPEQSLRLCAGLLHLTQAVIETEMRVRLWVVTQDCQMPEVIDSAVSTLSASTLQAHLSHSAAGALWGLGRTIILEHPQLHCTCIDLQAGDAGQWVQALCQEMRAGITNEQTSGQTDKQLLYQGSSRYSARLRRWQPPATKQDERQLVLSNAGSYLITGGLGALGLQVAQQLVADGAKYLILTGRRGVTTDKQARVLADLEQAGAEIQVIAADIANRAEAQQVIDQCTVLAPLRGIVHTAGVLDDGVLTEQTLDRFVTVMRPKINGTWHLHTLTLDMKLDFFVCFSSGASMLGSSGQSNYAAANAFMDSLMQQRQRAGLAGLSINWGPWGEIGLAAHLQAQMKAQGMSMITPQQGKSLFRHLLNQPLAQIGVLPFEKSNPIKQQTKQEKNFDWQIYQALSPEQRHTELNKRLCSIIALTGGFSIGQLDMQQSLLSIGIDSLMALQLRNAMQQTFQLTVPISLLLDGSTIASLTTYLFERLEETQLSPLTTTSQPVVSLPSSNVHQQEKIAVRERLSEQGQTPYQKIEGEL